MQARPEQARAYGLKAFRRALEGVKGNTAVHICFGYGHMVKGKPTGYSFLEEFADTDVRQVSVETAQPSLDCSVLEKLKGKTIILGVLNLGTAEGETPGTGAARIRRALPYVSPERLIIAPDCGLKYLPRESALGKMRAMVEGARIVREEVMPRPQSAR